ncbi:MAG: putative nucleic acid-binding Zn-ribbon protein [Polyangiales bacterium]
MLEELRAFAKLAEMDGAARAYERELKELPERLESMRHDLSILESLLGAERAQLAQARSIREERGLDLKLKVEALQKAKAKGSQARNLREVDAAEREVEANRRGIKEREEEIAEVEGIIESKERILEERDAQFDEAKGILDGEVTAAEKRIADLEALKSKALSGREELSADVPKRMMKMYERLRTRHKYDAATIIESDGICKSCRMALPAQLAINVQRAEDFHQCPQCKAFLVHRDIAASAGVGEGENTDDAE